MRRHHNKTTRSLPGQHDESNNKIRQDDFQGATTSNATTTTISTTPRSLLGELLKKKL